MTQHPGGSGKLPGKTPYAGRRRAMTRSALGFSVHKDTTGGEFRRHSETIHRVAKREVIEVAFHIEGHEAGDLLASASGSGTLRASRVNCGADPPSER